MSSLIMRALKMSEKKTSLPRRHFLLTLGTGGVAGAAVVAATTTGRLVPEVAQTKNSGYGERITDDSAHRRNYYRTARI